MITSAPSFCSINVSQAKQNVNITNKHDVGKSRTGKAANSAASMGGKMRQIFTGQNLRGNLLYYNNKKAARLLRSGGYNCPGVKQTPTLILNYHKTVYLSRKSGEKHCMIWRTCLRV